MSKSKKPKIFNIELTETQIEILIESLQDYIEMSLKYNSPAVFPATVKIINMLKGLIGK